jgi:hypothetical protein
MYIRQRMTLFFSILSTQGREWPTLEFGCIFIGPLSPYAPSALQFGLEQRFISLYFMGSLAFDWEEGKSSLCVTFWTHTGLYVVGKDMLWLIVALWCLVTNLTCFFLWKCNRAMTTCFSDCCICLHNHCIQTMGCHCLPCTYTLLCTFKHMWLKCRYWWDLWLPVVCFNLKNVKTFVVFWWNELTKTFPSFVATKSGNELMERKYALKFL